MPHSIAAAGAISLLQVSGLYMIFGISAGLGLLSSIYSVWWFHVYKPGQAKKALARGQANLAAARNADGVRQLAPKYNAAVGGTSGGYGSSAGGGGGGPDDHSGDGGGLVPVPSSRSPFVDASVRKHGSTGDLHELSGRGKEVDDLSFPGDLLPPDDVRSGMPQESSGVMVAVNPLASDDPLNCAAAGDALRPVGSSLHLNGATAVYPGLPPDDESFLALPHPGSLEMLNSGGVAMFGGGGEGLYGSGRLHSGDTAASLRRARAMLRLMSSGRRVEEGQEEEAAAPRGEGHGGDSSTAPPAAAPGQTQAGDDVRDGVDGEGSRSKRHKKPTSQVAKLAQSAKRLAQKARGFAWHLAC